MVKKERDDMMMEGIQIIDVPVHWVNEGEKRLDAGFYAQDVIKARVLLEKVSEKVKIEKLIDLADEMFMPALKITIPFYDEGEEYLTQSEVEFFLPKARKRVNVNKIENVDRWKVKSGYLLISQSGTIGRITIATKYLERFIISPNPIRVIINESLRGYIYAFLSSWIGQALIKSPQYGITVKHILPHQLYDIPIPRIPDLEEEINQKILQAHKLREEAQELLLKAEEMIYSELGLPKIDEDDVEYFGGEIGKLVKAFEVKASELEYRLDASYHLPIIKQIEKHLSEIDWEVQPLNDKLKSIFIPPRFKRPFVKSQNDGIRYIRPSDLPMIKYFEPKYLAKTFKNCDLYRLNEGDILVVTDGTIGWVSIVTSFISGWYGSNNFARVVPTDDLNRGYLLVYLLSPYGQYQLKREIFGGVIDHLTENHIRQIKIPIPNNEIQDKIGSLVIEAYNKKDRANQIEEEAIKELETYLMEIAGGE